MSSLLSKIESILFVASKPLSMSVLAKALQKNEVEVEEAIETLKMKYNQGGSGIQVFTEGKEVRFGTDAENAEAIEQFLKQEIAGELTKAQLETLTVIAYRGPVSRSEIEHIRGINCSIIIRNLMVRGLIEESSEELVPLYHISFDALAHLGIRDVKELPDYETFHAHEFIEKALQEAKNQES